MDEHTYKKDETPYLIFSCRKCHQFSYVKTTQKTKKCLRCRRVHQVKDLLSQGEIVYGMTQALSRVKERQNEMTRKKLGKDPELRSEQDFTLECTSYSVDKQQKNKENYQNLFQNLLLDLSKKFTRFPEYMIELMAESYGIPSSELILLINESKRKGFLIALNNEEFYFKLNEKKNLDQH